MMINDMVLFPNKNNWAIRVRNVLNNTGSYIVWQNQGEGNEIAFFNIITTKITRYVYTRLAFAIKLFFESITIS